MKRKILSIAGACVLSVIVLALSVGAVARQGHHGGPPPFGPPSPERMLAHLTEDLDLSADQVTQIKAIMTDEESKVAPYRAKMDDLDEQMRTATADGQFDEAKVREIAAQQAQVLTELIVERKRGEAKTFAVLTTEQRQKFEELRKAGPPHPPGRGGFAPGM
jgi:Spy/CpxP family protein refolding chaperone